MKIGKATIYKSPFLGVYSFCTDDYCIVPNTILKKEEKFLEKYLDVKMIKTQINESSLVGVFLCGSGNKLVVQKESIYSKELEILEKEGLKVKLVDDYNALGNLISNNSTYGVASPLLKEETIQDISKYLNIKIDQKAISNLDVPGSCLFVNDNLFLINPNIKETEFEELEKKYNVKGASTTLNYGDVFVGNDVVGNKNSILVGNSTSNIEIRKVDDLILDLE